MGVRNGLRLSGRSEVSYVSQRRRSTGMGELSSMKTHASSGPMLSASEVRWGRFAFICNFFASLRAGYDAVLNSRLVQKPLGFWRRAMRRARPLCADVIDNVKFQIWMFLITIYALVGEDFRMASYTTRGDDLYFNIVTITALVLFSFEMICSCIGKEDYLFSFFFWLDLVATSSLLLDITWLYEQLVLGGDTSVARAGRMSRVGTRAGRVIRVIRLLRLIRIIKLYRNMVEIRSRRGKSDDERARPGKDHADEEVYAESRVGQRLSQMTTQKVIVLILSMLIVLPIITVEAWFRQLPTAAQYGADVVFSGYKECVLAQNGTSGRAHACEQFEQQLAMYIGQHHIEHKDSCSNGVKKAFYTSCKLGLAWVGFEVDAQDTSLVFKGFDHKSFESHLRYLFDDDLAEQGISSLRSGLADRLNSGSSVHCPNNPYGSSHRYVPVLQEQAFECPEDLRLAEAAWIEPGLVPLGETASVLFVFDQRPYLLRSAAYSMLQTFFICVILALGAMVFSRDANVLVLQPIERMIALVQKIRDNPLYAMKLGDESYREREMEQEELMEERNSMQREGSQMSANSVSTWASKRVRHTKRFLRRFKCCRRQKAVKEQTMETKILENAIVKLGKLLALGFGEAGSEIIVKNMGDDTATVNAMIPGNKVEAVFGFCDIMHFTDTTEVLQDKVMVFVNQVAEIVHSIVDAWHGAANRNNGQAFLIVWRMREDFDEETRTKMRDMSIASFLQVYAAVNKSAVLKDYREHPALLARIPNYRVRMGFGLHYGWAIEGAIGSDFKIDASYLSPHVKLASRLEAATRHYQVPILVSESLATLCSVEVASNFRAIDQVTFKGGMSTPIRLYSVDLNGDSVTGRYVAGQFGKGSQASNPFEARRMREKMKDEKMQDSFKVHALFKDDDDIVKMRSQYHKRFFEQYAKGFYNYQAGEWGVARAVFSSTVNMLPWADGPSKALTEYMAQFDYDSTKVGLKGWPGHRELTEAEA